MITIEGYHSLIDWAEYRPENIDESKIWGFELHYRGGGEWFVQVRPIGGDPYEIGHGTHRKGISELLTNPTAKILKIVNYHSSADFIAELQRVMPRGEKP